jgi:RNA polymerase-binding transcription factor DksA
MCVTVLPVTYRYGTNMRMRTAPAHQQVENIANQLEVLADALTASTDYRTAPTRDLARVERAATKALRAVRAIRSGTATTCEACGEEFSPLRSDARYCSSTCRQRAYRARHD